MTWSDRLVPLRLAWVAGLLTALAAGLLVAYDPVLGLGAVAGGAYAAIAFRSVQAALVLLVPSFALSFFAFGNAWLKAGLALAGVVLVAHLARSREEAKALVAEHGGLLLALLALATWLGLSALWAEEASQAVSEWAKVGISLFVVVLTLAAVRRPGDLRWVAIALAGTGVFSACIGLAGISTEPANPAAASELAESGRITAGAGDPNVLAAVLVAAVVLCLAMLPRARPGARVALVCGALISVVGVAATQSRGGLVAAAVALVTGLIVFRRYAAKVLPQVVVLLAALAIYLAVVPGATERFSGTDDAGSGRTELWTVGWRAFKEHPVQGIGLNQFRLESSRYVLEPGTLRFVRVISERPVVVHNTYLQAFTETGLVGGVLYLLVIGICLSRALRAARIFEQTGDERTAILVRGLITATAAVLAAAFFYSAGVDYKLWLLLALGPAALAAATAPRGRYGTRVLSPARL